jgi:uncharacterized protein (TIGR01777 family)
MTSCDAVTDRRSTKMKVFITGGMGFVGRNLTEVLSANGHEVTVLDRSIQKDRPVPEGVLRVEGDSTKPGPWQDQLAEHDAVINLAGASIFQRWNSEVKRALRESRILTTKNVVQALAARKGTETHVFSTDAVGYYGFHGDEVLDENNPPGTDFLAQVGADWEAEALKAEEHGARVVITRFGLVMGKNGGVLGQLIPLFKWYLGSPLGSGKQWFSWVHEEDLANMFLFLLEQKDIEGAVNCTAPNPVRNKELTKILARVLGRPVMMPFVPGFMLRLVLGEFANVIVEGQRVVPARLLDSGFEFRYPTLEEALQAILIEQ